MPDPVLPKGYKLSSSDTSIPSFIRNRVDVSKVKTSVQPVSNLGAPSVAGTKTIAESTPGKIAVFDPASYTPYVRNHELVHQLQQKQSDGTIRVGNNFHIAPFGVHSANAEEQYPVGDPRNYKYGNEKGLAAARKAGKTMADFNREQQADIVADYKAKYDAYLAKAKAGLATPADLKQMYQTHETYHPYIQEMANVPQSFKASLPSLKTIIGKGKPEQLGGSPAAPGLPSYDVAGMGVAPADPLMGGQSVSTVPVISKLARSDSLPTEKMKGKMVTSAPIVGASKRFPNGKIGKWDGHGWVAQ
jgi:hypothetical protein